MLAASASVARSAGRRVSSILRSAAEYACLTLALVLVLEGVSRGVHGMSRPMMPQVSDAALAPRNPSGFESRVRFAGDRGPFDVSTDTAGLRVAAPGPGAPAGGILVVGDSQVFGWGLPFDETFAAMLAKSRRWGPARIMGAAGADVESLVPWAQNVRASFPDWRPHLNVITVNLGNDFEEMLFGRASARVRNFKAAFEWLTVHSYLMLDIGLARQRLLPSAEWPLPPGTNPSMFALDAQERGVLARSTAAAVGRLAAALPRADRTVIVLLPQDYQVRTSEFDKYRVFYPDAATFEPWRRRAPQAAAALDEMERTLAAELATKGFVVVEPGPMLRRVDPGEIFDRRSHHLTASGHGEVARIIDDALPRAN